jgi:hypothetical protein
MYELKQTPVPWRATRPSMLDRSRGNKEDAAAGQRRQKYSLSRAVSKLQPPKQREPTRPEDVDLGHGLCSAAMHLRMLARGSRLLNPQTMSGDTEVKCPYGCGI